MQSAGSKHRSEIYSKVEQADTYNQAEKVIKDWNRFGDDPGDDPKAEGNANPGTHGHPVSFVHPVSASEDADVK